MQFSDISINKIDDKLECCLQSIDNIYSLYSDALSRDANIISKDIADNEDSELLNLSNISFRFELISKLEHTISKITNRVHALNNLFLVNSKEIKDAISDPGDSKENTTTPVHDAAFKCDTVADVKGIPAITIVSKDYSTSDSVVKYISGMCPYNIYYSNMSDNFYINLNGYILEGNISNGGVHSRKGKKYKKCIKGPKCSFPNCKFYHSCKDIVFRKKYNIGDHFIEGDIIKNFYNISSSDFDIFEKRLAHDILVHQLLINYIRS